jgi:hypothetical protein
MRELRNAEPRRMEQPRNIQPQQEMRRMEQPGNNFRQSAPVQRNFSPAPQGGGNPRRR